MERSNALLSWWERSSIFPAANTYNTTTISAKQPNQIIVAVAVAVAVAVNFYHCYVFDKTVTTIIDASLNCLLNPLLLLIWLPKFVLQQLSILSLKSILSVLDSDSRSEWVWIMT
jgi:EamA domain-containing membrane protein RarD